MRALRGSARRRDGRNGRSSRRGSARRSAGCPRAARAAAASGCARRRAGSRDPCGSAASAIIVSRSWLVAATMRTSIGTLRRPPSWHTSFASIARRIFACADRLMSPISSKNSVPPSACRSLPAYAVCAPVNAPRSKPNSSLSSSPSGMAAQLMLTSGRRGPRAVPMDPRGDALLARARFAGDQHVAIGCGDLRKILLHFAHGATRADERVVGQWAKRRTNAGARSCASQQ